ncbi:cache domain-containing protein [Roseateles oligotrophus]|uniref:Cache domain-containing protein n=1 Tax=Roseateles oligotrophus TaxID=1769250 RepID=A0ABT2YCN8_9BURK|nr:cache domain-containing protein [Roseateles oligotrophus]MCV2367806.1 cache domain-containing protein [Roseateles oligotrophus]
MKNSWVKFSLGLLLSIACASLAFAQRATPEDAVAMVKKGAAYLKAHGKEKALAAFNDQKGEFVKGELYFFVYGTNGDGIVLAHGQNPKMLGKKLIDMRDPDGLFVIRDMTAIANSPEGKGWYKYKWPNTLTRAVETKLSYVERVGDIWIGCGIYQ